MNDLFLAVLAMGLAVLCIVASLCVLHCIDKFFRERPHVVFATVFLIFATLYIWQTSNANIDLTAVGQQAVEDTRESSPADVNIRSEF